MADISAYDAMFREVVAPRVEEIFDNTTILARWLERDNESTVGEQFQIPIHAGRNQGIGSRSEKGTLPAPGEQSWKRAIYPPKYTWAQFTLTQVLIEMSKKSATAFMKAFTAETEGVIKDVNMDRNRQFFGDGTGLLATLGVTAGSTTVTCTDTSKLAVNMRVDILVKTTGAVSTGGADRKITSITKNTSFVIDGAAITTDATFGVYRQGNRSGTTYYEMNGLQNIAAATGTVGTLDPSTAGQEFWLAYVSGAIGALTEAAVQIGWDAPAENGFDASDERLVVSNYGTRRAYAKLLNTLKQYHVATTRPASVPQLAGGFDALAYNGTDWVADRMSKGGDAYILDRQALTLFRLASGFKDDDGTVLKDDGGSGYVARHYTMEELGTGNRQAHSKLVGVTEA